MGNHRFSTKIFGQFYSMANVTAAPVAVTTGKNMKQNFNICDFYLEADNHDTVGVITACINLVFSIPAILGNLLVLFAIRRTPSMGLPSKVILCSLAFSDLSVGLIVQPSFALHKLIEHKLISCIIGLVYDFSSGHLSVASLLTMVFISLDKFMALHLKLRYRAVVTYRRSFVVVVIIWTISIPWSASYLIRPRLYFILVLIIIPLSFLVTSIVFIKIYTVLRRQQNQLSAHSGMDSMPKHVSVVDMSLYRKSVTNMVYIYCALLAAYFPIWIVLLIRIIYGQSTKLLKNATELALLVVLINSTVNPVLYLWRIREIRLSAKELLQSVFLRRSTGENVDSSTLSTLSWEPRIQHIEGGLEFAENYGETNDISSNGLANNHDVFTTHF